MSSGRQEFKREAAVFENGDSNVTLRMKMVVCEEVKFTDLIIVHLQKQIRPNETVAENLGYNVCLDLKIMCT